MLSPILTPTPIQRVSCPEAEQRRCRLYIKRDDLLPCAFGGNKVRIAHEFLADMARQRANALIMYGDLRSNLCRVLSLLCREEGVPCLMVATSAAEADAAPSYNEEIIRRNSVEVLECPKGGIADAVDEAFSRLRAAGRVPYYIYGDRTGTGNEGVAARAYQKAYGEMCDWEGSHGLHFDLIFTPYGTGSTQGGLICGSLEAGDGRAIVGISISSRPPERARSVLEATVRDWYEKEGKQVPPEFERHVHLECGYTCGGYGVRSERVDSLIEEQLALNSVPLDPTYTGKALRGTLDYLSDHDIRDKDILFLHTGGLPLFFDYLEEGRGQEA